MESKKLFFYELEGRGYIFQNKKWDETKHGFEDDMLTMAWEMWSSGQAAKAEAVPEGFVLVSKEIPDSVVDRLRNSSYHWGDGTRDYFTPVYQMIIEAQEPAND